MNDLDRKQKGQLGDRAKIKSALFLLILFLLLVLESLWLNQAIEKSSQTSYWVNISGRQRFLVENIYNQTRALVFETQSVQPFSQAQQDLQMAVDSLDGLATQLSAVNSQSIFSVYFEPPYELKQVLDRYIQSARKIAHLEGEDLTKLNPEEIFVLSVNRQNIIDSLDEATFRFQTLSKEDLDTLKLVFFLAFGTNVLGLFILFFWILSPMIKSIEVNRSAFLEQKTLYDSIVQSTGQLIYDHNLLTGSITWSGAVESITGYSQDEFQHFDSARWKKHIHTKDRSIVSKILKEAEKTQENYHLEYRFQIKSGEYIYVEDRGVFFYNETNQLVRRVGIMQNVTLKRNNRKSLEELVQTRSRLLQVISHQIRTPLTSMRWSLEMLIGGDLGKLKKEHENLLKTVLGAQGDLIDSLNDILRTLDIAEGKISSHPTPVLLDVLLKKVMHRFHSKAKKSKIKMVYEGPKKRVKEIHFDENHLYSIFYHLIKNAIEYSKEKGQVTVVLKNKVDHFRVEIYDEGIGVAKEDESYIFNSFFRAENAIRHHPDGSGLGLFIVQSYVKFHKGKLGLKKGSKKGSMFWVELPIVNR